MAGPNDNLLKSIPRRLKAERFDTLFARGSTKIERIVSQNHASPPGFWYDQPNGEWVMLLTGSAALRFEGELDPIILTQGDFIDIPAHRRHRIEWTDPHHPTVWLAVHYG